MMGSQVGVDPDSVTGQIGADEFHRHHGERFDHSNWSVRAAVGPGGGLIGLAAGVLVVTGGYGGVGQGNILSVEPPSPTTWDWVWCGGLCCARS